MARNKKAASISSSIKNVRPLTAYFAPATKQKQKRHQTDGTDGTDLNGGHTNSNKTKQDTSIMDSSFTTSKPNLLVVTSSIVASKPPLSVVASKHQQDILSSSGALDALVVATRIVTHTTTSAASTTKDYAMIAPSNFETKTTISFSSTDTNTMTTSSAIRFVLPCDCELV